MTQSRREKLEEMLKEEPRDEFLRYSLAMELEKEGDHEGCLTIFNDLMTDSPPYVPAFFMAAQQQVRLGKIDIAKSYLRDGIEHARSQNNLHAAGEMSELLQGL